LIKKLEPLEILDEYYSFLSSYKTKSKRNGYSSEAINQYIRVAKDFLNHQGCKIYNEDMKLKFRLPKRVSGYQRGLTREAINRVIRFANPKLATIILIACSSGMRIGEMVQLKLSDVDLSANPTTITIRAKTTKTRETRLTHISSEATNALKDYLARYGPQGEYLFLRTHELKDSEISDEEKYSRYVVATKHNLESQLERCIKKIPELNAKNENQNWIHFHAFRAWFKTQVTDSHQSDFAEALMGHKSLKLVYYRQNDKTRAETYQNIEHCLIISDTEKIDQNYSQMQNDNQELRSIVDSLSRQLQNLEKRIYSHNA
jgi:integrase